MAKGAIKVRCPTCAKLVQSTHPEFPFCSPRCRLIDLGKWASGEYVVSSPLEDTSENLPEARPGDEKRNS
jgi:endogenous inhibitor of DNA gyrase (YacG/DUF329 family)